MVDQLPRLPKLRFHPVLGVAIQLQPNKGWLVGRPSTGRLQAIVPDEYVLGPGWRKLDVTDPDEPITTQHQSLSTARRETADTPDA